MKNILLIFGYFICKLLRLDKCWPTRISDAPYLYNIYCIMKFYLSFNLAMLKLNTKPTSTFTAYLLCFFIWHEWNTKRLFEMIPNNILAKEESSSGLNCLFNSIMDSTEQSFMLSVYWSQINIFNQLGIKIEFLRNRKR